MRKGVKSGIVYIFGKVMICKKVDFLAPPFRM